MIESPYIYKFDPTDDSTAARVVRNIGNDKYVLELGCAYGVMTKVMVENYNCRVFGVEYDAKSAQHAKPYCEDLAILDIENADWEQVFGDKRFDVIVAADVLEHLRDPQKTLISLRRFLVPDGYIVVSLPNVAHNGVIAELFNEDFRYRETGLLDATHLRFWGAHSIKRLLQDSGFVINNAEMTRIDTELSEFADAWSSLPVWLTVFLKERPDGNVYQYIIKASLSENTKTDRLMTWPAKLEFPQISVMEERVKKADLMAEQADIAMKNAELQCLYLEARIDVMEKSKSWRITRPLRFLVRLVHYGFLKEDKQRISQFVRKRYHRWPLPASLKKVISFIFYKLIRKSLRILHGFLYSRGQFNAPVVKPVAQQVSVYDYIVWGVVDWHFRYQRPQQLSQSLVNMGRRVFYISPKIIDDDRSGFEVEALDSSGLLFQINLFMRGAPSIYSSAPTMDLISQARGSIGEVLLWAGSQQLISLVQHPYWCDFASVLPNSRLVYDCMDHHEGFENTGESLLQLEKVLFNQSDLTITTSTWLDEAVAEHVKRRVLIRNAGEYDHFSTEPETVYRDSQERRIIGYYGAVAEWFDEVLVELVAERYPDCCILIIGADTNNIATRLRKYSNVIFKGEVEYNKLPFYLYGFDVCLLPFNVIPLTLATNPVKVYEYLSAGKPVVCVDLPEMKQFDGLVYVASNHQDFVAAIGKILERPESDELIRRRRDFAAGQTWMHRGQAIIEQAESSSYDSSVSVVVVTYNNIDLTKACLTSLDEQSQYENLEIIVVDNASSDGSQEFLQSWLSEGGNRKLILNEDNRGFSAANNQGLNIATGEYLVMLNNDTYVTPGWLRTLVDHLKRDESIGLIGPVTNNIGNEAKIDISYDSMNEMLIKSAAYTRRHIGQTYPLRTAAFFCVMLERNTYEEVGQLDEDFGRGFFEDDDYCRRIEKIGLRIVCAEDVFVHHNLSASFNKLGDKKKKELFDLNKELYEKKWGEWLPHRQR